jgi:hypothetical protein
MKIRIKPRTDLDTSYDFPAVQLVFKRSEVGGSGFEVGVSANEAIKIGTAGRKLKAMIESRRKK